MAKPNILLLMTDQQRWDAMSCSGDWVQTPNMDRIASEGVRFQNCVTNSPVCIPTRLSLATGLYPHNTGIWDNLHYDMAPGSPTWMQKVREAGYRTSVFGKTHLHRHQGGDLRDREPLMRSLGIDDIDEIGGPRASTRIGSYLTERWKSRGLWEAYQEDYRDRYATSPHVVRPSVLPLEEYADVYVGQQSKKYLENYTREEPWMCWISFGGPHEPWDTPEPYASRYDPKAMPKPAQFSKNPSDRPRGRMDTLLESAPRPSEEESAAMRANYAGNISLIDDQIGEILDTIEARGELENTIIVFCSDHGEFNGDYGLVYKHAFLDGAVRVPLIIRTPETLKRPGGQVSDALVEWFDIGPTLVELVGSAVDSSQFGKSLVPVLAVPTETHRDFAISELQGEIMILTERWKMLLNESGEPYYLFDRQEDPGESINRVRDETTLAVQQELKLKILEHLVRNQIQFGEDLPPYSVTSG